MIGGETEAQMTLADLIQLTTIIDWSLPPEEDRLSIARSFAASMEDFHRRMSEVESDEDIDLDSSNSGSELHVTYLSKKFSMSMEPFFLVGFIAR